MCAHNLSSETQLNAPNINTPDSLHSQVRVTVGGPGADIGGMNQKAIQAGIDYVASLGGETVELLEGEYFIEDAVRPRNNTILRGQGAKTILKKNGGTVLCSPSMLICTRHRLPWKMPALLR